MTEGKSTEYVVLRHNSARLNEAAAHWQEDGRATATSAKEAIKQVVGDKGGTFVAIPARSFQPVTVTIEQKATLKFGEAKKESPVE